ncbi:hypothetical protein IWQ60_004152 [Tieghemiomyces parasiticus]|uniref:Uncharacterized protein n=1 Tax=Tieghemiomyces parasiticus TaxID=78921 RepID=A0A9W8A8T2_9FUNG|nr:hypothetical protein IWQ60_004152 [Tieghemiomyces parasiticus]
MSNTTLFIGNISYEITRRDLEEEFGRFGEIIRIEIKRNGFAFVEFRDIRDAEACFRKTADLQLCGRHLAVDYAKSSRAPRRDGEGHSGCFSCGRPGHFARECPDDPRRSNDYRSSRRDYDDDRRGYGGRRDYDDRRGRSPPRRGRSRSPYGRRSRSPYGGGRRGRSPPRDSSPRRRGDRSPAPRASRSDGRRDDRSPPRRDDRSPPRRDDRSPPRRERSRSPVAAERSASPRPAGGSDEPWN